jgi:hypothetical protein
MKSTSNSEEFVQKARVEIASLRMRVTELEGFIRKDSEKD